jgi:hypothetical protein
MRSRVSRELIEAFIRQWAAPTRTRYRLECPPCPRRDNFAAGGNKTDAAELPDGDSIDGSQKPKQGGQPRQSLNSRYLP